MPDKQLAATEYQEWIFIANTMAGRKVFDVEESFAYSARDAVYKTPQSNIILDMIDGDLRIINN